MRLKKGLFQQIEKENYLKELERLSELKNDENKEVIRNSKLRLIGLMIVDFTSFVLRAFFYLIISFLSSVGVTALINNETREILLRLLNLQ